MPKTNDTRAITGPLLDAYLEMVLGVMALRMPEVQSAIERADATFAVTSSQPGKDLVLDTAGMIGAIRRDGQASPSLRHPFTQINSMFLVAMWDALRAHVGYDKIAACPDVQFFRHVRNGCGHGNRFKIDPPRPGEEWRPARWRGKEITLAHHGTPVFPDFLRDGDVILLATDINDAYFACG